MSDAKSERSLSTAALVCGLGVIGMALGEVVVALVRGAHRVAALEVVMLFADLSAMGFVTVFVPLTVLVWLIVSVSRRFAEEPLQGLIRTAWGRGPSSVALTFTTIAFGVLAFLALAELLPNVETERPMHPRLWRDVALVGGVGLALVVGRVAAFWRKRALFGAPLEVLILITVLWLVTAELTYFLVPTSAWYSAFVLALTWSWVGIRLVVWFGPQRRRIATLVAGLGVLSCASFLGTYQTQSLRHATLTWDTSVGASLWRIVRFAADDDGDGYPDAFGGPDCDDDDPDTHLGLPEDPNNGRDDNCVAGETPALPPQPLEDAAPQQRGNPKNVVVLTIDTLRADYVGRQVAGRSLTPNLDRLAAESFVWTRAYSASSHTAESMPAAWTGTYPFDWRQHQLAFGIERSLAEVLTALRYEAFATIAMTWVTPDALIGFDDVDNQLGYTATIEPTGERLAERALERFDARGTTQPFFMWAHLFDPHAPYLRDESLSDWLGDDLYMHEVHVADAALGTLIDGLRARDALEDTILVFFSDHGESLGEHGIATHKLNAHDSVMRIPLMIRAPGITPGRSDTLVSTVDILPTLMDLLEIAGVPSVYGRSLAPAMRGRALEPRPFVYFSANDAGPLFKGIATTSHKLIYDWRRDAYFLYDLEADPRERRNLVDDDREHFEAMKATLWSYWDAAFSVPRLARKAMKRRQTTPPRNYSGPPLRVR